MSSGPAVPRVLVDTDVFSYLHKGDTRARLYGRHLEGRVLLISFMTVAEVERWALVKNWGEARRAQLELDLSRYVVSAPDRGLCRAWAKVCHEARRLGRSIASADAWIAATAWHLRIPLVTHNRRHYDWLLDVLVVSES